MTLSNDLLLSEVLLECAGYVLMKINGTTALLFTHGYHDNCCINVYVCEYSMNVHVLFVYVCMHVCVYVCVCVLHGVHMCGVCPLTRTSVFFPSLQYLSFALSHPLPTPRPPSPLPYTLQGY